LLPITRTSKRPRTFELAIEYSSYRVVFSMGNDELRGFKKSSNYLYLQLHSKSKLRITLRLENRTRLDRAQHIELAGREGV